MVTPSSPAQAGHELILCWVRDQYGNPTAGQVARTRRPTRPRTRWRTIAGVPLTPDFTGLAPTFIGAHQINVRVPPGLPTVPMTIQVLDLVSPALTIAPL